MNSIPSNPQYNQCTTTAQQPVNLLLPAYEHLRRAWCYNLVRIRDLGAAGVFRDEIDAGFSSPLRSAISRVRLHEIRERCISDERSKCVSEILRRVISRENWAQLQEIQVEVRGADIFANYSRKKDGPCSFAASFIGLVQDYAEVLDLIRENATEIAAVFDDKEFMDRIDSIPDENAPLVIIERIARGSATTLIETQVVYDQDRQALIEYGIEKGFYERV